MVDRVPVELSFREWPEWHECTAPVHRLVSTASVALLN